MKLHCRHKDYKGWAGSFKTLLYYYANHLAHPFQPGPGEGPRKGLLCDCEKSNFLKVHFQLYWSLALVIFVPQYRNVSSRMAAFSFCPQFKWKRCSVVPVCGGPNQALCMAHSEIEWICSHLSHILEKSGFLRHWITERMFSCFTFNLLPIPSIEAICPLCLLAHYVASLPHIKLSI